MWVRTVLPRLACSAALRAGAKCRTLQRRGLRCAPLLTAACLVLILPCQAQEQAGPPPATVPFEEEKPLPGDWAVELLFAMLNSPNSQAADEVFRAAVAAGPQIIPQLEEALKDDRTAEFAAQALAFIGGPKALEILWKQVADARDLNLRRFYYGALGEFDSPEAVQTLLDVINRSDDEPDRTVTEAAILALTVRSDPKLIPPLREAEARLNDVVIRLDLENAIEVIERRAKYLATPEGKAAGGSVEQAVRTYFAPALLPPEAAAAPAKTSVKAAPVAGKRTLPDLPDVKVRIENVTLTPDQTRALARVVFEDPTAAAYYDIVLQKRYGNWEVASVWLGKEVEKPAPLAPARPRTP